MDKSRLNESKLNSSSIDFSEMDVGKIREFMYCYYFNEAKY